MDATAHESMTVRVEFAAVKGGSCVDSRLGTVVGHVIRFFRLPYYTLVLYLPVWWLGIGSLGWFRQTNAALPACISVLFQPTDAADVLLST